MNERDTPETDDFYATFADGLASPSQDEWLERMKRYERQRDDALDDLRNLIPAILKRGDKDVMDMTAMDRLAELHESERQRDMIRDKLLADDSDSIVGACDCLTKTPEARHHKRGCKYRMIVERDGLLEALEDWLRVEDDSEDYFEAQGMKREPDHWVVAKARAAIAAVKGDKQP